MPYVLNAIDAATKLVLGQLAFETFEKKQKLEKRDQSREIQNYINQMDHSESMEKNRERIEYRAIDSCTDRKRQPG